LSTVATVARAVVWNAATGVGARLIGLVGTLVLARFISPQEYGEVAAAVICVVTASEFTNLQLGQYLIVNDGRERGVAFHVTCYHIALGLTALLAVFWARDLLGPFVGAPSMGRFVPGFVLASAMDRIAHAPEKLLARDLRFRVIAITRGTGEVLYTALALSFAPTLGGMAIVIGNIGRSSLALAVFATMADRRWLHPQRLSKPTSLAMLRFSVPLALANMADFAASRWDNLIISRLHGAGVMGTYNLAYNLAQTSTGNVADSIADVLFPSFARLDPARRGPALVRAISTMALVTSPLAFGLASVAGTAVSVFFPARWALIAPMLTVLSVQSAALPLGWTFSSYYKAQSRTKFVMAAGIVKLAALLAGLVVIGRFGPLWACFAVDLAFAGYLILLWSGLLAGQRSLMWPSARGVLRAMLACVPMLACVLLAQAMELRVAPVSSLLALCIEVPAGVLGFVIGAALFARETSRDVVGLVIGVLRKTAGPDTLREGT
jgi:lipopolysaccharide exporter